jgi:hypothetical protein
LLAIAFSEKNNESTKGWLPSKTFAASYPNFLGRKEFTDSTTSTHLRQDEQRLDPRVIDKKTRERLAPPTFYSGMINFNSILRDAFISTNTLTFLIGHCCP